MPSYIRVCILRFFCISVAHISANSVHLSLVSFSKLLCCVIILCGLVVLWNTVGQYLIVSSLIVDCFLLSRYYVKMFENILAKHY